MSVDGFIARTNDDLDFLEVGHSDPHGYEEFIATIDAFVWGRGTFDKVKNFKDWPVGKKPVFVLSSRPLKDKRVERLSGEPAAIVEQLAKRGIKNLYVDGGITVQRFLAAGLIDRLVITRVPVLIGSGIPLFGPVPHDIKLKHVATRSYPSGLVQTEYLVM